MNPPSVRKAPAGSQRSRKQKELQSIDNCVAHFTEKKHLFQIAADQVMSLCTNDPILKTFIHFIKARVKEPERLREKLHRRMRDGGEARHVRLVTPQNLFERIPDLAGVRILHLHTDQIEKMNNRILEALAEQKYEIVEGPVANCWDNEADQYFRRLKFATKLRDTMYTSVHYVIQLNPESKVRCELQVRTLADEVWGEVSHTVNYPTPTGSIACNEQLKVLARVTSGCTRLVDSIFRSQQEYEQLARRPRRRSTTCE